MIFSESEVVIDNPRFPAARLSVRQGRQPTAKAPVTLVFLHEALGSVAQWRDFPERLAQQTGCDLLVYDRVGHGRSSELSLPRPDDYLVYEGQVMLPELLRKLGIERALLVGHSDGGSIALVAASQLPDRVLGVITEAAHLFVEPVTRTGIEAAVAVYSELLRPGLQRYHGDKVDTLFQGWYQTWLRDSFQALDLVPWLAAIKAPVLAIQGYEDQYGSDQQVEAICEGVGQQASACWLECGHSPHRELAEQSLAVMADFIRDVGV